MWKKRPNLVAFDSFVLDPESREIYRLGKKIDLQAKPFLLLMALARRPGHVITRQALQLELWGESAVDARSGLNTAVRKVREALADNADQPRYIETIPRLGYRFMSTVRVHKKARSPRFLSQDVKRAAWVAMLVCLILVVAALTMTADKQLHADSSASRMGQYLLEKHDIPSLERAVDYFQLAIQHNNASHQDWLGLARCRYQLSWQKRDPVEADSAFQAANRVLDIDPTNAFALLLASEYRFYFLRQEWPLNLEDVLDYGGNDPEIVNRVANLCALSGQDTRAIDLKKRVTSMDPGAYAVNAELGYYLYKVNRYSEAIEACREALQLEPQYVPARFVLVRSLFASHALEEAKSEASPLMSSFGCDEAELAIFRDAEPGNVLDMVYAAQLRFLLGQDHGVPATRLAAVYAQNGDAQAAMQQLILAFDKSEPHLIYAFSDPDFAPLIGLNSFQQLKERFYSGLES